MTVTLQVNDIIHCGTVRSIYDTPAASEDISNSPTIISKTVTDNNIKLSLNIQALGCLCRGQVINHLLSCY